MTFSKRRIPFFHNYSFDDSSPECIFIFKDLDIYYSPNSPNLNFEHHINRIIKKMLKVQVFITYSTKTFRSVVQLHTLYCAFVCSILEYSGDLASFQRSIKTRTCLEQVPSLCRLHPQNCLSPCILSCQRDFCFITFLLKIYRCTRLPFKY